MSHDAVPEILVLRCADCGDTFSVHDIDAAVCRSCGGRHLEVAGEPLL